MSIAKFILDFLVYNDSASTNDPQQRLFDYKKQIDTTVSNSSSQILLLPGATITAIAALPTTPKWIYIETDQQIKLRFNGNTDDTIDVSPSVALTPDGVFFKRGTFTSLSINVPGVTGANVKIYMGN